MGRERPDYSPRLKQPFPKSSIVKRYIEIRFCEYF